MARVPETSALRPERKADMDVLGTMRRERGEGPSIPQKQKSTVDLIWDSVASQMPPGVTREKFVIALARQIKTGPHKLLQVGNTVFLMTALGPGTIEFVTFTREPLPALIQRYKTAADIVRKIGVRKIRAWSPDPGMQRIAKSVGLPVTVGQGEKMLFGKMVPVFTFEIDLGAA
jgi:hypothetical protein